MASLVIRWEKSLVRPSTLQRPYKTLARSYMKYNLVLKNQLLP
jgi:hypothetical protein